MKSQASWDRFYMDLAKKVAQLSYAPDKKVGAVLVHPSGLVSFSYNGTVPGSCNCTTDEDGKTLDSVLHAEHNAIMKVCRTALSTTGSTIYTTLSPCMGCAKMIYSGGVCRVVYEEPYKHGQEALNFLRQSGILVNQDIPHCQLFNQDQLKYTGLLND